MSDSPRFLLLRLLLTAAALTASLPGPAGATVQVTAHQPLADANDVPVATSVQATFSEALNPVTVTTGSFIVSRFVGFKAVAAGWLHTVALKIDGTVVAWGKNDSGETTVSPVSAYDSIISGAITYDRGTLTATFTPAAPFPEGSLNHVAVAGVRSETGAPHSQTVRWSFTTTKP